MRENEFIPISNFYYRQEVDGAIGIDKTDWVVKTSFDIFQDKRCLVFSVPGPFTPICSGFQLPRYDKFYNDFKFEYNIDEVYCHSVSDFFVMQAWFKDQNIKNVKMLPDGNGDFARLLGMYVDRTQYGMGKRSWRHAFISDMDMRIERLFTEPHIEDNIDGDPYEESSPENVLEYLRRKKAGEDIKSEWLFPDNVPRKGKQARVLGVKTDD